MPLEPITREENFLARIAGDGGKVLEPITRTEHFLQRIIDVGGSGEVTAEAVAAAIVFDTSMESRIGEAQGVTSLYTVTTSRVKVLEYHDVFRRVRDGKVFRVTSDGDDKHTPNSTPLDMRQVTAEEFLPAGEVQ